MTQIERDHAERARGLRKTFKSVERLADFMHQNYRAAAKALANRHRVGKSPLLHDHGFCDCYGRKKEYFIRRAAWLLAEGAAFTNGRVPK